MKFAILGLAMHGKFLMDFLKYPIQSGVDLTAYFHKMEGSEYVLYSFHHNVNAVEKNIEAYKVEKGLLTYQRS